MEGIEVVLAPPQAGFGGHFTAHRDAAPSACPCEEGRSIEASSRVARRSRGGPVASLLDQVWLQGFEEPDVV